jgi:hypothetical protein
MNVRPGGGGVQMDRHTDGHTAEQMDVQNEHPYVIR